VLTSIFGRYLLIYAYFDLSLPISHCNNYCQNLFTKLSLPTFSEADSDPIICLTIAQTSRYGRCKSNQGTLFWILLI